MASEANDLSLLRQQAEQVIRDHDEICIGHHEWEAPYCSAAPNGTPLCPACQKLADKIVNALVSLTAREREIEKALNYWQAKKVALDAARPDFTDDQLRELVAAEGRLLAAIYTRSPVSSSEERE